MSITRRCALKTVAAVVGSVAPRVAMAAAPAVRVGFIPVLGSAPVLVLAKSKWARDAGLELALTKLDPLARGGLPLDDAYDALAIGVGPLAAAHNAGSQSKIVANLATAGAGFVAVPTLAAHLYANADPAVAFARFRDQQKRPARLATTAPGVVPSVLLHHWLFKRHAVPRDLVSIEAMDLGRMQVAIVDDSVDGATLPEPLSTIVRARRLVLQRIISGSAMFPDAPGIVLAVSPKFAAREDTCRSLVRGVLAAARAMRDDPFRAAPLLQEGLGLATADLPQVTRALASANIGFATDPRAIRRPAEEMLAFEVESGDLPSAPPIATLFDDRFYPPGPT